MDPEYDAMVQEYALEQALDVPRDFMGAQVSRNEDGEPTFG